MAEVSCEMENRQTRGGNAAWVIEQVRELGLHPHPSSRLMRMCRTLNRGFVDYDDDDFPIALESMRDLQHLGFVFAQLRSQRTDPQYLAIVKSVLKDSALPQQDLAESPGRDKQFELYLAAICQNAGLLPVACAEPDVTCVAEGIGFGIAAKRLKSFKSLKEHIRKAADQIARSKRPGVIALDLSFAWNRENAPVTSPVHSQMLVDVMLQRAWKLFDDNRLDLYAWVADQGVLAIVAFDFATRVLPERKWAHQGLITWFETTHEDEQAVRQFQAFNEGFLKGVPKLTDLR